MKPYTYRYLYKEHDTFKYRLLWACHIIKYAFSISASCFQILLNAIKPSPVTTYVIILACYHLKNKNVEIYLQDSSDTEDISSRGKQTGG
jgi:hypothetical protein